MRVLKGCGRARCLSTDCLNGIGAETLRQNLKSNKSEVFQETKLKLKGKLLNNQVCIIDDMSFVSKTEASNLEGLKSPEKLCFLMSYLDTELVNRFLVEKAPLQDDLFKIALYVSLNRLIALPSILSQREYLKNVKELLAAAEELDARNKCHFLRILEDRVCWEYLQAIGLLDRNLLNLHEAELMLRLFFELSLLFEIDNFRNTLNIRMLVQLFKFSRFEYLFEPSGGNIGDLGLGFDLNEPGFFTSQQSLSLAGSEFLSPDHVSILSENLQNLMTIQIMDRPKYLDLRYDDVLLLRPVCALLEFLYGLSKRFSVNFVFDTSIFQNSFLSDDYSYKHVVIFFLKEKYINDVKYERLKDYLTEHKAPGFNFLDFPFLISTERKVEMLHYEAGVEKSCETSSGMNMIFAGLFPGMGLNIQVGLGGEIFKFYDIWVFNIKVYYYKHLLI